MRLGVAVLRLAGEHPHLVVGVPLHAPRGQQALGGDREVDDDVRRLLEGRHAITLRIRGASSEDPENREDDSRDDEMDVDELDADCISSYTPSRAASPAPGQSSSAPSGSGTSRFDPVRRASLLERRESANPYITRRGSSQGLRRHQRRTGSDGAGDAEIVARGLLSTTTRLLHTCENLRYGFDV